MCEQNSNVSVDKTDQTSCETCHLSYFACPGHYGHIELPAPVYHPLFMNQAYKLLYATCLYCHHFKMPKLLVRDTFSFSPSVIATLGP
jgi:DNA-directed RNA polymerase beta' subunit